MAQRKIKSSSKIVEKNLLLTREVMNYLLSHPQTFDSLPDNFELVILPEDDAELRLHNLELLDKFANKDAPIVFARTKIGKDKSVSPQNLRLFAPLLMEA